MKFKIKGKIVRVSIKFWAPLEGPKPPEGYETDGCSWSPDTLKGLKVWPACVIHDYHYREHPLGKSIMGRLNADNIFRRNVARLLIIQGCKKITAYRVSYSYFMGVRLGGAKAYGLRTPLSLWIRLRSFFG